MEPSAPVRANANGRGASSKRAEPELSKEDAEYEYIGVTELARRLNITPKTVYNKIGEGTLNPRTGYRKFGGRTLFNWQAVRAALERGEL
jgi:excisionase family DNA binding protein